LRDGELGALNPAPIVSPLAPVDAPRGAAECNTEGTSCEE